MWLLNLDYGGHELNMAVPSGVDIRCKKSTSVDNCAGGGFFLVCEDFGRMFANSFPTVLFFFFLIGD